MGTRRRALLGLLAGCSGALRGEVGYSTQGWRAGVSLSVGVANNEARRAITQAVGIRHDGTVSATTTTRAITAMGPLWASGALELDEDGLALVPALIVPLRSSRSQHPGSSIFPDSDAHLRTVTEQDVIGIGVQPRLGRAGGEWVTGIDIVVELLALSGTTDP